MPKIGHSSWCQDGPRDVGRGVGFWAENGLARLGRSDRPWLLCRRAGWLPVALAVVLACQGALRARAADRALLLRALESIRESDLQRYVDVLANDTYEGREAGSRGGRAASTYLVQQFERLGLEGGADQGGYFQTFGAGYRNVLGVWPGRDPDLRDEYVIFGAHFDHVGYGNSQNSFGPTGFIHNGADDNASGTAGLLEIAEALVSSDVRPRRTVLFALWDGEEKGLLGSYHWVRSPTVPLEHVAVMVNTDMIGRLRRDRLEVFGTRTAAGLREMIARQNFEGGLRLDFRPELRDDSDHYPFYARGIPFVMLHTGLHDDYHRPSDDVERVNLPGAAAVTRLATAVLVELADRDALPAFRTKVRSESSLDDPTLDRTTAAGPGRLGVSLREVSTGEEPAVQVVRVSPGSSAERAALRSGDRILSAQDVPIRSIADLQAVVLAQPTELTLVLARSGEATPRTVQVLLSGAPVRVGVTWRMDDAEPGCAVLTRIVAGSPADRAGLRAGDRVWELDGHRFERNEEFRQMLLAGIERSSSEGLSLVVEREGRVVSIRLAADAPADAQR